MKKDDLSNVNRGIIKKIKKDLVQNDDKFSALRPKYMGSVPDSPEQCNKNSELFTTNKVNIQEICTQSFDILKEISKELKNDPNMVLENLTKTQGKASPATALILKDQSNKTSKDLLDEALTSRAPKMKGVKKDTPEQSPAQAQESQELDQSLKDILDSQPELLKEFMQKNDIDEGLKN